jgi:hypothetical protein
MSRAALPRRKGDGGKAITSFAIVTTDAAPSLAQYHNRMPVVLDDSQFDDWMRGTPDQAAALIKPYAGEIETSQFGAEVGNVKTTGRSLWSESAYCSSYLLSGSFYCLNGEPASPKACAYGPTAIGPTLPWRAFRRRSRTPARPALWRIHTGGLS